MFSIIIWGSSSRQNKKDALVDTLTLYCFIPQSFSPKDLTFSRANESRT